MPLTGKTIGQLDHLTSSLTGNEAFPIQYDGATYHISQSQIVSGLATTGSNTFIGNQNITGSLIQGLGNAATGENSHAEGDSTQAIGLFSHAEGLGTTAYGGRSHAEGQDTIASGSYSHAEGYRTIALADHQHVQGQWNATSSIPAAFIVGNGTDDGNRSNLIHAAGNEVQISGSLKVSGSLDIAGSAGTTLFTTNTDTLLLTGSAIITGSVAVTGSLSVLGSIIGSLTGNATTATSASFASTASSANNFTVRGTLTAITIVAQTITASTEFITGSTRFGSLVTDTHQFTGSVSVTGSLNIASGLTTFTSTLSGSQPSNNPSSSLLLISGSIRPTGSLSGSSAVLMNTVMSASANNQTLVGMDIIPAFNAGAFTGITTIGLRILSGSLHLGGSIAGRLTFEQFHIKTSDATIASQATSVTSYSGLNMFDSSATLGASFQYGNASAAQFANTFFFGPRNSTGKLQIVRGTTPTVSQTMFTNGNFLIQDGGTHTDNGYRLQVQGSGSLSGSLYVSGSSLLSGSLNVIGNTTITGSLFINNSQFNNTSSLTTAGTTTISSLNTASYISAFYNYAIISSSNARAGQIMSIWSGSTIRYTEAVTSDIGNTSTASFAVALSGGNVNLNVTAPAGWTVRTITNLL